MKWLLVLLCGCASDKAIHRERMERLEQMMAPAAMEELSDYNVEMRKWSRPRLQNPAREPR